MKPFHEFDLQQFAFDQGITKPGARCARGREIVDVDRLAGLLCCTARNVRAILSGTVNMKSHTYALLAFHLGEKKPELL